LILGGRVISLPYSPGKTWLLFSVQLFKAIYLVAVGVGAMYSFHNFMGPFSPLTRGKEEAER